MKSGEMTAEKIWRHIDCFVNIYDEKGNPINKMPEDVKITVWCSDGKDDEGFVVDSFAKDLGLNAFIAQKWILQTDLEKLMERE